MPYLMSARIALSCLLIAVTLSCTTAETTDLQTQITAIERSFARTMAQRDLEGFKAYLSDEAIFFNGPNPLRGKQRVAAQWQRYFTPDEAPFAWEPEVVEVLDSGKLALSSVPVFNADGEQISIYSSIWRQEQPGVWRIVFDKGYRYCE